jgi:AsmA-like C-terminal region
MLLVLLSTTAIYLTPLDVYVPEIEQTLSDNFGEPVKIRHLKLEAFPLPHLTLKEVVIGDKPDITLQSVGIFFDLHSLLKAQRVIRRLVLEQGSVTQEQLARIMVWVRSSSLAATKLRLNELQFNGIQVIMPGLTMGPLQGQMELNADSSLSRALVIMPRQQGVVLVYPQPGGGFQVKAGFHHWSPPDYPDWVLDSLNVNGVLTENQFKVNKFSAEMLGAQINGMADLEWRPEWQVDVHMDAFNGELGGLLPLMGSHVEASGMLHAMGHLEAHGANAHELPGNIGLDLDVGIRNVAVRLPFNTRMLLLDSADSHVTGTLQKLNLNKLAGRLYGGTLNGTAVVQHSRGLLDADVTFCNISLQPLVEALSNDVVLTGQLNGRAKLSAQMNEFDRFPANVQLNGNFQARHGVLGKVDLVQAASNPLKNGNKGGKTGFDELSGLLSVDGSGYHLNELKVSSGAVNAAGRLDISPQLQLNGLLDTDLNGTAALVSMPLAVSGTMRDPVLHPTGSTLAGAAVGTALLGPGLGTALGIKIGNLLHKMLGAKNEKIQLEDKSKSVEEAKAAEEQAELK